MKIGSVTSKSQKASPVKSAVSAQRRKIVNRKVAPWVRPEVVLPYGPEHFTIEQIEKAVKKAA